MNYIRFYFYKSLRENMIGLGLENTEGFRDVNKWIREEEEIKK